MSALHERTHLAQNLIVIGPISVSPHPSLSPKGEGKPANDCVRLYRGISKYVNIPLRPD